LASPHAALVSLSTHYFFHIALAAELFTTVAGIVEQLLQLLFVFTADANLVKNVTANVTELLQT